jgi:hypothetical protein
MSWIGLGKLTVRFPLGSPFKTNDLRSVDSSSEPPRLRGGCVRL